MQYLGNYRGIVFGRTDPNQSGRVKVWVPAAHREIYRSDIERIDGEDTNATKLFGGLSKKVVDYVSASLPWAEVAQPLVGGGGGSEYVYSGQSSVGDGPPQYTGTISVDKNRFADKEELRGYLLGAIRQSRLNDFMPEDGATYGVDGSAESWANYFYKLAEKESSFKVNESGNATVDPGGSYGLYQVSPKDGDRYGANPSGDDWTISQLYDPVVNTNTAIKIHERNVLRDGVIVLPSGKGAGGYFASISMSRIADDFKSGKWPPNNFTLNISDTVDSQKPANAFGGNTKDIGTVTNSGSARVFVGARNDILDKTGSFSSNPNDRKISLDFNAEDHSGGSGEPTKSFLLAVPSDLTSDERVHCDAYLAALSEFYKPIGGRANMGYETRGLGIIFTEPFFASDKEAASFIKDNSASYNQLLLNTLGKISGATFIAPHNNPNTGVKVGAAGSGAVMDLGGIRYSEFSWAMDTYIKPMSGGVTITESDAFGSVGNKHPEQVDEELVLKENGASEDAVTELTNLGIELYNKIELYKSKPTDLVKAEIEVLRVSRKGAWRSFNNETYPVGSSAEDVGKFSDLNNFINNLKDYTDKPDNNKVNPISRAIAHSPVSNVSRGSFTIPDVGSNVWVFFEGGDLDFPVVLMNNPSPQDYASAFGVGSPSVDLPQEGDSEAGIHRDKSLINGRGGSIETVGTTGNEAMKFTGYHGSSVGFDKMGLTEFVSGNKSQLIKADRFSTIRGDNSMFIGGDDDLLIRGDIFRKFGDVKKDIVIAKEIKSLHKPIHEKQQLFELKRTDASHSLDSSSLQERVGVNTTCPTCSGENTFTTQTNKAATFTAATSDGEPEDLSGGSSKVDERYATCEACFNCLGTGTSPWSAEGEFDLDERKNEIAGDINANSEKMSELENKLGSGGNITEYVTKSYTGFVGTELNDLNSIRVDPLGKRAMVGQFPSSDGRGVFPMYQATPHVEHVAVNGLTGGEYSLMVANKYSLLVGANGISQKTLGQYEIQGRILTISGDQVNISSNNEVSIDGGKLLKLTGDNMEIAPRTQTVGGKEYKNVAFNSGISVASNQVVKGGMFIEGETYMQHLTAPEEFHETETTISMGGMVAGVEIGRVVGNKVISVAAKNATVSAHSHIAAGPAMNLVKTNDDVRRVGSAAAESAPILAEPVEHGKPRGKGNRNASSYKHTRLFNLDEDCSKSSDNFDKIVDFISEGGLTD